jgi:hypothetical protein
MNLSPTARTLLTAVASGVAALGGLLAAGTIGDAPEWLGVAVAVLGAVFAALGVVPPQVGGTQEGVVNPSVKDQAGYALVEMAFAVMLLLVGVGVLVYLT